MDPAIEVWQECLEFHRAQEDLQRMGVWLPVSTIAALAMTSTVSVKAPTCIVRFTVLVEPRMSTPLERSARSRFASS